MYRLLVVDDEYNIREGLANAIPWRDIDVEVIGAAVDGEDAYDKVALLSPDIVITDVNMDNLNGLELTSLIRQNYPFVKIIILSGYDDFEFVSKALELKVSAYIIKPIQSEELTGAVHKVILEIESDKKLKEKICSMEQEIDRNKSLLVDKLLHDILNGAIGSSAELDLRKGFLDISFRKKYYACVIITITDQLDIVREVGMKKLQGLVFSMRSVLYDVMNEYELWPLVGGSGSLTIIVGIDSEDNNDFRMVFEQRLEQLVTDIQKHLGIHISITIGGIYGNILDVSKAFIEASRASEYNAASANASIIFIDDVPASHGGRYFFPADRVNLLLASFNDATDDKTNAIISDLFDIMEKQPKSQTRINIMGLYGMVSRKAMELGVDIYQLFTHDSLDPYAALERFRTRDQIEKWFNNIVIRIKSEIKNQHVSTAKSVIVKATEFLKDNYANPYLSLADISSHVFFNASYFSRLYKKETGESYVETLTMLRLEKAKKLLKETNIKIADISNNTGYPSSRYFCSLFKKHTGFTPLEYRKS